MIKRKKRAIGIISLMLVASISIYAILWALKDNIVFFYSPSEINQKILSDSLKEKSFIRLGGMVKESSIVKLNNGSITFVVTDFNKEIKVFFKGIPPDLFREGQGVIAEGSVGDDYTFTASSILAKHDENYMPPEVEKILKKEGFK